MILLCSLLAECLKTAAQALRGCDFSSRGELDKVMRDLAADLQVSYRNLMLLCRLAITGVKVHDIGIQVYKASRPLSQMARPFARLFLPEQAPGGILPSFVTKDKS